MQTNYALPPFFDMVKLALLLSVLSFLATRTEAQTVTFNQTVPTDITICQGGKNFTVSFTNKTTSTLTNLVAAVQFPTGIHYVQGSLANVLGGTVTEENVGNTNNVRFSAGSLAPNATLSFELKAEAQFAAYNHVLGGNIFRNTLNLSYAGGSVSNQSSSYNVLYPALTITTVNPLVGSVTGGQTFTRTVTIVNGGFGATSQVRLNDTHGSSLTLTATNKGTLNTAGTQIMLSSADFTSIGDGDGLFEKNESITLTETVLASGCTSTTSSLQAFWGCVGGETGSNTISATTTINQLNPSLGATATPSFNTCANGDPMQQRLRLTNTGAGIAQTVVLSISPTSTDIYSGIDPASIQYKLNGGNLTPIAATSTTPTASYPCLSGRVGGFTISLPNIPSGGNIEVFWNSNTCNLYACGAAKLAGWKYNATCKDACNSQAFTKSGTGLDEFSKNVGIFFESPSDLMNGQTGSFHYLVSSATVKLPTSANTVIKAVFDVPNGLTWSGNAADLQLVSGVTVWQPTAVMFDPATKKLTATYPYQSSLSLARAELRLRLTTDCSLISGSVNATLGLQLFYNMDNACPSSYDLPLTCVNTLTTKLHCPGACAAGMMFNSFSIERTSFGKPDNNLDGLPDATGLLDFSKVKKNRVMVSDTFKTVFSGKIMTSASYPSWAFGKAKSVIPSGDKITVLGATVRITDASTGQVLICENVPFTQSLSGTTRTVIFNFSPATLASGGCTVFSGFVMGQDDEVELTARYRVSGNPGGSVKQLTVDNDFYVSQTANGAAFQCDDWNGNFTLIGYVFSNSKQETVGVNTCTKVIEQSFYLAIGDGTSNYAGGNLFPSEFRNWAKVQDVTLVLPPDYAVVSANLKYYRTQYSSKSVEETIASLTPSSVNGQQFTYQLASLFTDAGGTLNPGDDGFNGTVFVEIKPTCNVTTANQAANWQFRFKENTVLGGNITAPFTSSPDILQYKKGKIEATAAVQIIQGTGNAVSWELTVKNNGDATAPNSWFHLLSPGSSLTVTEVRRISNNQVVSPVNGFYQLGSMSTGQSVTYRISATFTGCAAAQIIVYSGNDCNGYPTSLAAFSCPLNQYPLTVVPQESELQARLSNPANANTGCNAPVLVELELLSAKLGLVKDIEIKIQVPSAQSLSIVPGSVKKLYPASGSFQTISTPSINNNTYVISGANLDPVIGSTGLVGITDVSANSVKIRLELAMGAQFEPGDFAIFTVNSKKPCGTPLPTLAFAFDPNAVFRKMDNIGLQVTGDNWASSWADYNGDGHVDLFVTTYGDDDPNQLFKNNGNGTFTKITAGSIVNDNASSLASTWGDMDNDGDLDLFVANSIGAPCFLYRNDGNGSFTRITDSPVADNIKYAHGASWVDYDDDGWLDLFVATYFSTNYNYLFHNNGNGTFSRTNNNPIAAETASSVAGLWGDYDNDGLPDLFVANTNGENNSLYHNEGNGNFTKITAGAIVNDGGYSVGASWGDYDNDGWLDLFVSNASNENNFLYHNNGGGSFTKITSGIIVNNGGHSHGSAWADYDNDGWLDLIVANDQGQNEFLYHNNGKGSFNAVGNAITQAGGSSFGASWADYDNDGDPDLWLNNRGSEDPAMYNNARGQCQSSLSIKLTGTRSNRAAIGSKICVKANIYGQDLWQMREISAQSGGGIGGQNDMRLLFGLGDALAADSIVIKWASGFEQVLVNKPAGLALNIVETESAEVCGVVYNDTNRNCKQDEGELGISNAKIVLLPGNITAYTNNTGRYSVFVKPGGYQISQFPGGNWSALCPSEQGTSILNVTSTGSQFCGNDFGNTALCALPDLRAEIASTAHRLGEKNLMVLNFENKGAGIATRVLLDLNLPDQIRLLESTLPYTTSGRIVSWQVNELQPGEKQAVYLTYELAAGTGLGENLSLTASIKGSESDCNNGDNSFTEMGMAVASFDPNDILVSPERLIRRGEWLQYKIRFQNIGNLSASQVQVEDLLPEELDLSTLEIGAASHAFRFQADGRRLTWLFPNINLPDSTSNEPGSHGFVSFRVQPSSDMRMGDKIRNSATIYFDNHEPIVTNEVENVLIGNENLDGNSHARPLLVFPNPTSGQFTVQSQQLSLQQGAFFTQVTLINGIGRTVYHKSGLEDYQLTLSLAGISPGQYFVKTIDNEGRAYLGKVVVE